MDILKFDSSKKIKLEKSTKIINENRRKLSPSILLQVQTTSYGKKSIQTSEK